MKEVKAIKCYSPIEEKINIISHAIGFVLSMVALVLLVTRAIQYGNAWHIKFNHAIFHLLVLIGSFCHFVSVYFYVLSNA